jgi:RNA polymerase sigma-70 factor (ECF subfamily)
MNKEILGTSVGALKASYHHAVKKIEVFVMVLNLCHVIKAVH